MSIELGDKLKALRKLNGLTQKQVSAKLGYTTSQFVSNWERGICLPPAEVIGEIAGIYNIPKTKMMNFILKDQMKRVAIKLRKKSGI